MIASLDQRVTQITQAESSRIRMLVDHVSRLTEGLQAMRVAREIQEERRQKELRILENNAQQDFVKLKKDRRDLETRVQERGDRIIAQGREEIRKFPGLGGGTDGGSCVQTISDQVHRLAGILEEQRAAREEYGERIQNSLEAEFQKLDEAMHAERKLRGEALHTMESMVQDVCARMSSEIQQEREQRETVQGKLLGLLEETCGRIEASFSGGPCEPMQRAIF